MKFKLEYKIFLLVVISIVLTTFVSSYIFFSQFYSHIKQYAINENKHSVTMMVYTLDDITKNLKMLSKKIINNQEIQSTLHRISHHEKRENSHGLVEKEKIKFLEYFQNITDHQNKLAISLFDRNKTLLLQNNTSHFPLQHNVLDTTYLHTTHFEEDIANQQIKMILNKPIVYEQKLIGYLSLVYILDINTLHTLFRQLHSQVSIVSEHVKIENIPSNIQIERLKQQTSRFCDTKEHFVEYQTYGVERKHIYIVASYSKDEIYQHLLSAISKFSLSMILFLLFLIAIIKIFTKKNLLYPLQQLLSAIDALKNKQFNEIAILGNDEISEIAREFSNISSQLQHNFRALEENNIFLNNLLDTLHLSVFIKDVDGKFIFVNKQFLQDCNKKTKEEENSKKKFNYNVKKLFLFMDL